MRTPVWLLFGLIVSILIMDVAKVAVVRNRIITTVEHSLDAALVAGLEEVEASRGQLYINEAKGKQMAYSFFRGGLRLNSNLENESLKQTSFVVTFTQNEVRPEVTAEVNTTITAMTPKIVGLQGIPVTIKKRQYHHQTYK